MNSEDNKQLNNQNLGSQINSVGRFGNNSSKDSENIKNKINDTRTRNLNRTHEEVSLGSIPSNGASSLGDKPSIDDGGGKSGIFGKKKSNTSDGKQNGNGKSVGVESDSSIKQTSNSLGSSIGSTVSRGALGALRSKSEVADKAASTVEAVTFGAKAIKWLSMFFTTPLGIGVLYVLSALMLILFIVVFVQIIVSSIGAKFGLSGRESLEVFNEKYAENLSREELEEFMSDYDKTMCKLSFIQQVKHFFGKEDLSDNCELAHYIKNILEEKESDTNIKTISPGYFMSSLYYAFDTQNYDSDGNLFINPSDYVETDNKEELEVINDLDAITTLMAVKLYDKEDLNELLDMYVFHNYYTYWIYTYFPPEIPGGQGHYECVDHYVDNYNIDEERLNLFLRYGRDVAHSYVFDYNRLNAFDATSSECEYKLGFDRPSVDKYKTKADVSNNNDDKASISISGNSYSYSNDDSHEFRGGTYTYEHGFIFTTYPRYMSEYSISGDIKFDYMVAKDTESIINNIASRQDYMNYILGYPSTVKTSIISSDAVCSYNVGGVNLSNIKVRLTYGSNDYGKPIHEPIPGQDLIDFEKYVAGVVYAEISGSKETIEASKAQAIAARTFAIYQTYLYSNLNLLTEENGQTIITIRNSTDDQVYCDPDTGCYKACDGYNTVFSGNAKPSDAVCEVFLGPIAEDHPIREAAKQTAGMILLNASGKPYATHYNNTSQNKWKELALLGKDYVEILRLEYGSEATLQTNNCSFVTGEWDEWKQGSEPWGSMLIGNKTMGSVGCLITSFAKLIAKGAPQIVINNFNPGTFMQEIRSKGCLTNNSMNDYNCAVRAAVGNSSFELSSASLEGYSYNEKVGLISQKLNQGYEVIIRVKSSRSAAITQDKSTEHYVFVTGINGNNIIMSDPASRIRSNIFLENYVDEGLITMIYVKFG